MSTTGLQYATVPRLPLLQHEPPATVALPLRPKSTIPLVRFPAHVFFHQPLRLGHESLLAPGRAGSVGVRFGCFGRLVLFGIVLVGMESDSTFGSTLMSDPDGIANSALICFWSSLARMVSTYISTLSLSYLAKLASVSSWS